MSCRILSVDWSFASGRASFITDTSWETCCAGSIQPIASILVRSSEDEAQHPVQTRAALWREFKRDTQTAWLEAAMRKVYVKNAENR
jgi:hypothetical protein